MKIIIMSVIFIIIFLLLFIFIFVVSLLLSLLRGFFSLFGKSKPARNEHANGDTRVDQEWDTRGAAYNEGGNGKILFGKDEGEYVDFEEIKEDDA